jgi:ATP-binding cassette, subfamily B, bacterial
MGMSILDILRTKFRMRSSQPRHLLRALVMVWEAAHLWTVLWLVLLIVQGLLPVVTVYLTRALVNTLAAALLAEPSWDSFKSVLPFAVAMAVVLLLTELFGYAAGFVRSVQGEMVRDHISGLIHKQSVAADLALYDMPNYYDRLYRAQNDALDRPLTLLENLGSVFQNTLTLIAMIAVLKPYGMAIQIALLASSLPAFYVVLHHRLKFYEWRIRNTESERRTWYYNWLLTDRETAAEMRIFNLGDHFQSLYQSVRARLRNERQQLAQKQSIAEAATATVALLITGSATVWMLWNAIKGSLTIGDLALFYQAFQKGQGIMGALFVNMGEIYSNSIFLNDLFEFLDHQPQVQELAEPVAVAVPLEDGIRFENVTFHYPASERVALSDFNLTIPVGRIVAIVGSNGAGKSTLVKLLCRFYDPAEGRILMDGIDLRQFKLEELRRQITILFQEPVYYHNTLSENIALGDLSAGIDAGRIAHAAQAAGADKIAEDLPNRYDTLLGKWFEGGTELSVGQWQRVALARAYWRQAPILVLDEPTSAMDPWAEHDWLQHFRELASGHTTLIITHRFTTAMYADTIHVMEAGRVVESGSHTELLSLGGRYAQSWRDQMRMVQGNPDQVSLNAAEDRQNVPLQESLFAKL